VTSANDCRSFGAECLAWAKTACSDEERQAFLQMARTWLYAAASLEGRLTRPSDTAPPQLVRVKRQSVQLP
jgi:hypothetical protein